MLTLYVACMPRTASGTWVRHSLNLRELVEATGHTGAELVEARSAEATRRSLRLSQATEGEDHRLDEDGAEHDISHRGGG
jgi:hypothetical protein